jgi:tetratricopeptide (TPR) repeat protein
MDDALSEYRKAIEINPDYARGYYNIGSVYREQGKIEEAIASFQKALEINPKYGESHYMLAVLYFEKKEYPQAVQHCEQALKYGVVVDSHFLNRLKPYR